MRLRCLVIALTFLAAIASDSWGQSKQPPAESKQATQPPATDQRGTEQVPLAVKILPAQDAKEQAEKAERERKEKAVIDEKLAFETQRIADYTDRLARFTVFLFCVAIAQAGLFVWQLLLIQRGMKDTREAADAAKLSAQAVIAAERAYVFVEICLETAVDMIKYMQGMQSVDPRSILIQYRFTNYGKTPAVIKSISYGAVVAENLPRQREYSHVLHLPTHLLGAETSTKTLEYDEFKISAAIADSIQNLTDTFWFYGEIVYDDMFDRQKTFDFVFHVSGISEGFTLYRYGERDEKRES
jgi:hypothetical protein